MIISLMKFFDFFKRKNTSHKEIPSPPAGKAESNSEIPEAGFEFLIIGNLNIPAEEYDQIMTPNSFEWLKLERGGWTYYQVGNDEFSYSWEEPGIQMTFNKEIAFEKAKKLAGEVVNNIKACGQEAELVVLDSTKVYHFDQN